MEDSDFFDHLYQVWSKTTGSKDKYWKPEEDPDFPQNFNIIAVGENGANNSVASFLSEEDSDFITALHGCLPDLIRRLGSAIDEADRLDTALDEEINRVGAQVLEILELKQIIQDLEGQLAKQAEPSFQRDFTAYHAADTVYPFGRQV